MSTGHRSSLRAAKAGGRDAQNWKIWRKIHSVSVGLDSRKYSAIRHRDSIAVYLHCVIRSARRFAAK
jgi:hypothetical protein